MTVLNLKGYKVVNGTTLIKNEALDERKGGDKKYDLCKFVQMLVNRQMHKALRDLAWERDIPLRDLLAEVFTNFAKQGD